MIKFDELTEIINLLEKTDADEQVIEAVVDMCKESRFQPSADYTYEATMLLSKYWKGDYDELYGKDASYTALSDYLIPNRGEKKLEVD